MPVMGALIADLRGKQFVLHHATIVPLQLPHQLQQQIRKQQLQLQQQRQRQPLEPQVAKY